MAATTKNAPSEANGFDLVKYGYAASLNRPGGNITGVTGLSADLNEKRVSILHELLPHATTFAFLSNGSRMHPSPDMENDALSAARTIGLEAFVVAAGSERAFDAAFATLIERQASALIVGAYLVFSINANKIVALAAQHKIPAIYIGSGFVRRGGLMSYGGASPSYRQVAIQYVVPIPQGRQAGRSTDSADDKIRIRYQPQDRQGARPYHSAELTRARRRGHRINPWVIFGNDALERPSGPAHLFDSHRPD